MLFFGQQLKQAKRLIREGELNSACQLARQTQLTQSASGRRFAHRLIDQLVNRAGRSAVCGDLESAWNDLGDAASIATEKQSDRVTREKHKLVDNTIEQAAALLVAGKPSNAMTALLLLRKRNILDRRADEVFKICDMITEAEELAKAGRINDATSMLQETKKLRPELTFLNSRIRNYSYQKTQLAELTKKLRYKINDSAWQGAEEVTQQILQIAPKNQIALDALQRCADRAPTTPAKHSLADWENRSRDRLFIKDPSASIEESMGQANEMRNPISGPTFNQLELPDSRSEMDTSTRQSTSAGKSKLNPAQPAGNHMDNPSAEADDTMRSFMLWVDGVGGYLVCTRPEVTIGRAVPDAHVDVPLQADIRRRHVSIKRSGDGYLMRDLGDSPSNDAADGPVSDEDLLAWELLATKQTIKVARGVEANFSRPNPLGGSARLEFTSRHRTEPWSDAVLLMGDAILMGPDNSHHVVCPHWNQSLVLFRQGNQVILRVPGNTELELSGSAGNYSMEGDESSTREIVLSDGLRVASDEFSISCEQVS